MLRKTSITLDKGSVGLNLVNNWPATAATNDSSDVKYATAGAVKKAYDLANTKLNATANAVSATKLQTARNIAGVPFDGTSNIALTAANVGALALSGGTTTGDIKIQKNKAAIILRGGLTDDPDNYGRVRFEHNSGDQHVQILHSVHDGYREPFGLRIQKGEGNPSAGKAWLEAEGEIYADTDKIVYHAGNKPFKVHHIAKPSGAVDGKYYPVLIAGALNNQQIYINTRSSGGKDPMNNCSFSGEVRASGQGDGKSYAHGMFTIYHVGERAIHSLWMNSESEGVYAFYVEARAFPLVIRVDASCSVTTSINNIADGTSVYPAALTSAQLDGAVGTKITNLQHFDKGIGYYSWDGAVNDQSKHLSGSTNFDALNEGGTYNLYNAKAKGSVNPPPFAFGTLLVIGRGTTPHSFVTQIATDKSSGKTYVRTRTDTDWAWTSWVQLYDSVNKPTPADIGAYTKAESDSRFVNVTGDTMTGNLTVPTLKITTTGTSGITNNSNNNMIRAGGSGNATIVGNTSETTYIDSQGGILIIRNGSIENTAYHTGNKPSAADVGAYTKADVYTKSESDSRFLNVSGDTMSGQLINTAVFANTTANAHIFHDCRGTAGTKVNLRSMREANSASWLWEKVAGGSLYYSTGTTGGSADKIRLDVSGGQMYLQDGTKQVYHTGNLTRRTLGAAPDGYGLGDYGKSISTILGNTDLRRTSGFFQGSNIQGLPTTPHSWNYVFSQAHGNAAGYFGYLAISFAGTSAWIGGQEGGTQKGPYELVKRGDSIFAGGRVEINTGVNPMLEFHMPGKHAVANYVDGSGNFRIATSNGAGGEVALRAQFNTNGELYVAGNVNANDVYIRSDKRLKSNFKDVDGALNKVLKLKAYSYDKRRSLKDSEIVGREVGLIAQDLRKVLPEAVSEAEDTTLTISNSAVNALLVEAIKELKAEIELLKSQI